MIKQAWIQFLIWIEHLFTPHCVECAAAKRCKNCDDLRLMLEQERNERMRLIQLMTEKPVETDNPIDWNEIRINNSWRSRRQQLENQAREKAREMQNEGR